MRRMICLLLILMTPLLSVLAAGAASKGEGAGPVVSAKASTGTPLKILALGDSLTAGHRLDQKLAFPAQLEKLFIEAGYLVKITNAGVSGDTASQGLNRMDWVIKRSGPFDVLLLELGANDGLRQSSVEGMKSALEGIIQKSQKLGLKVFLLGIKMPTNFDAKYRKDFEAVYTDLAKKFVLPLYPFILEGVADVGDLNLEDRLHPNEEGHQIVAKNLFHWLLKDPKFLKLLKKK